jgi:hypothetical protein
MIPTGWGEGINFGEYVSSGGCFIALTYYGYGNYASPYTSETMGGKRTLGNGTEYAERIYTLSDRTAVHYGTRCVNEYQCAGVFINDVESLQIYHECIRS